VPLLGRRRRVLRCARRPLPQAGPPAAFTLRSTAEQIAGARNAPAALDRNEALDGALGLVKLALYQLGSAEGEVTSTEGEPA
jgi:hypothetical protein